MDPSSHEPAAPPPLSGVSLKDLAADRLSRQIKAQLLPTIKHYIIDDSITVPELISSARRSLSRLQQMPLEAMGVVSRRLQAVCNISALFCGLVMPNFMESIDFRGNISLISAPQLAKLAFSLPCGLTRINFHKFLITDAILQAISSSNCARGLVDLTLRENSISDASSWCWPRFESLAKLTIHTRDRFTRISLDSVAQVDSLRELQIKPLLEDLQCANFIEAAYCSLLDSKALPNIRVLRLQLPAAPAPSLANFVPRLAELLRVRPNPERLEHVTIHYCLFFKQSLRGYLDEIHRICPNLCCFYEPVDLPLQELPDSIIRSLKSAKVENQPLCLYRLAEVGNSRQLESLTLRLEDFEPTIAHFKHLKMLHYTTKAGLEDVKILRFLPKSLTSLHLISRQFCPEDKPMNRSINDANTIISFICSHLSRLKRLHLEAAYPFDANHARALLQSLPELNELALVPTEPFNLIKPKSSHFAVGSTNLTQVPFIATLDLASIGFAPRLEKIQSYYTLKTTMDLISDLTPQKAPWLRSVTLRIVSSSPERQDPLAATEKQFSSAIKSISKFESTLDRLKLMGAFKQDSLSALSALSSLSFLCIAAAEISTEQCKWLLQNLPMLHHFEVDAVTGVTDTRWLSHPYLRTLYCKLRLQPTDNRSLIRFDQTRVPNLSHLLVRLTNLTECSVSIACLRDLQSASILSDFDTVRAHIFNCPVLEELHITVRNPEEMRIQGCPRLRLLDLFGTNIKTEYFRQHRQTICIPRNAKIQLKNIGIFAALAADD